MSSMTLKLAQRASKDTSLMASLIDRFGEKENLRWEEIANRLWIDDNSLAKLALCRRPRASNYSEDVAQMAGYVGLDQENLTQFISSAEVANVRRTRKAASEKPKVNRNLFSRYAWVVAVVALVILLLSAFVISQPGSAAGTVAVIEGDVTVLRRGNLLSFISGQAEQSVAAGGLYTVQAGDTIILGEGGFAQIKLQDGSTIDLFENTRLYVETLEITDSTYQVRFKLLTGKMINRVLRILNVGDAYEVITPSSTISVRGTVFTVEVLSPEATYVACEEGIVWVQIGDRLIEVRAGEEITTSADAAAEQGLEVQPAPSAPTTEPDQSAPPEDPTDPEVNPNPEDGDDDDQGDDDDDDGDDDDQGGDDDDDGGDDDQGGDDDDDGDDDDQGGDDDDDGDDDDQGGDDDDDGDDDDQGGDDDDDRGDDDQGGDDDDDGDDDDQGGDDDDDGDDDDQGGDDDDDGDDDDQGGDDDDDGDDDDQGGDDDDDGDDDDQGDDDDDDDDDDDQGDDDDDDDEDTIDVHRVRIITRG